jgi:hypothetical protein
MLMKNVYVFVKRSLNGHLFFLVINNEPWQSPYTKNKDTEMNKNSLGRNKYSKGTIAFTASTGTLNLNTNTPAKTKIIIINHSPVILFRYKPRVFNNKNSILFAIIVRYCLPSLNSSKAMYPSKIPERKPKYDNKTANIVKKIKKGI